MIKGMTDVKSLIKNLKDSINYFFKEKRRQKKAEKVTKYLLIVQDILQKENGCYVRRKTL